MSSHCELDDKDLDDAALWAVIDSAAASRSSITKSRKPLATRNLNRHSPIVTFPISNPSPPSRNPRIRNHHNHPADGEVLHEDHHHPRPNKIARSCVSETTSPSPPLVMVKHVQRTPTTPSSYCSPEVRQLSVKEYQVQSPIAAASDCSPLNFRQGDYERECVMTHSLSGRFPTVSLFKDYQNAAMAILEKSDYTMISGSPFIKKSGWRKISFYFNLSYEIKDKTIEFDENRNVQRAEFIVRAHMQGGRFSDGWGSCERREKRFLKPNHDIPSTAETRAKNKACQDLLGIGEYRPGLNAQK